MRSIAVVVLVLLLIGAGCSRSPDVDVTIRKYSDPPPQRPWDLVDDTEEFWRDVATLYKASVHGDRKALHTLLMIDTYTDGGLAVAMPDLAWAVEQYPEIASDVIMDNPRLKRRYRHWVEEQATGQTSVEPVLEESWSDVEAIACVSARGWELRPGPTVGVDGRVSTVVVNPRGEQFNIGETPYPDFLPATLWIVPVPSLNARFLIIRVPPVCTAAMDMPVLYVDERDRPTLAATIRQRFEFEPHPEDTDDPRVIWDGEHFLRDILFEDSDGDGAPELVEKDFWKREGTVTYYRFTSSKKFVPIWREEWGGSPGGDALIRKSRTNVDDQPSADSEQKAHQEKGARE